MAYTAVPNKGRRDLFFFCFFFSFQQRKKEEHLLVSISHRKAKEKQAQQTLYQSKNHPQNKHPEYQHSTYKKRQTKAFASPRRTARETSDSAERVSGVRPRIIYPPALSGISSKRGDNFAKPPLQRRWHAVRSESEESRANNVRPYGVPF